MANHDVPKSEGLTRRSFVQMAGAITLARQAPWLKASIATHDHNRSEDAISCGQRVLAFVGTTGKPDSVLVYSVDGTEWQLRQIVSTQAPAKLILHPSENRLYVLNEISECCGLPTGSIQTFSFDSESAELKLLGQQVLSLSAVMPRDLAIAPNGKSLVVAVSGGGSYNLLPILPGGNLGKVHSILKEFGNGPVAASQGSAHPQCVVFDITGGRVISADLGNDTVSVLKIDSGANRLAGHSEYETLSLHRRLSVTEGSGPRHLALHPSGNLLYVAHALNDSLSVFWYDSHKGTIQNRAAHIEGLPIDAMTMHPSGNSLFVAGRGMLKVFKPNLTNGAMELDDSIFLGSDEVHQLVLHPNNRQLSAVTQEGVLQVSFHCGSTSSSLRTQATQPSSAILAASIPGARSLTMKYLV